MKELDLQLTLRMTERIYRIMTLPITCKHGGFSSLNLGQAQVELSGINHVGYTSSCLITEIKQHELGLPFREWLNLLKSWLVRIVHFLFERVNQSISDCAYSDIEAPLPGCGQCCAG